MPAKKGKAYPDYNKFDMKMDMEYVDEKKEARKFYRRGMKHFRKKRYYNALEFFQKALEYNPGMWFAHLKMARVYKELEDPASAAVCYENYLEFEKRSLEALNFLMGYYIERENHKRAAEIIEKKIGIEKNAKKLHQLQVKAALEYTKAKEYTRALEIYHEILRQDIYNPWIFEKLQQVYSELDDHRRWRVCEDVLQLNNRITSSEKTRDIEIFKVDHPLTSDRYTKLVHPGQKAFVKYFGWLQPLFKLLEQPTPPNILRLAEVAESDRVYNLFKECCHYMNMKPPVLRRYVGPTSFKFLADPMENDGVYSLIYNQDFIEKLTVTEQAYAFISQLVLFKSDFICLLNLNLTDVTRVILEMASMIFGILSFMKSVPLKKAARLFEKTSRSKKIFNKITIFQKKISRFKFLGKSADEIKILIGNSIGMLSERVRETDDLDKKSLMNKKFLESVLASFYFTADRTAYYFTRDLIVSTRTLVKLLEDGDALERIEKFGLHPYITETKNNLLKQRLAELFLFAVDVDLKEIEQLAPKLE